MTEDFYRTAARLATLRVKKAYYERHGLGSEKKLFEKAMPSKHIAKKSSTEDMMETTLSSKGLASMTSLEAEVGVKQRKKDDAWCVVIRIPFDDKKDADDTLEELLE